MQNRLGKLLYKVSGSMMNGMAAMALVVTAFATNRCCMWFFGQDEMPENAKKLRKF